MPSTSRSRRRRTNGDVKADERDPQQLYFPTQHRIISLHTPGTATSAKTRQQTLTQLQFVSPLPSSLDDLELDYLETGDVPSVDSEPNHLVKQEVEPQILQSAKQKSHGSKMRKRKAIRQDLEDECMGGIDSTYRNPDTPRRKKRKSGVDEEVESGTVSSVQTRSRRHKVPSPAKAASPSQIHVAPQPHRDPTSKSPHQLPRTPQKPKPREIPSSQSPPATPFSPHMRSIMKTPIRSPLQQKSSNFRKSVQISPFKKRLRPLKPSLEVQESIEEANKENRRFSVEETPPRRSRIVRSSPRTRPLSEVSLATESSSDLGSGLSRVISALETTEDVSARAAKNIKTEVQDSSEDESIFAAKSQEDEFAVGVDTQAAFEQVSNHEASKNADEVNDSTETKFPDSSLHCVSATIPESPHLESHQIPDGNPSNATPRQRRIHSSRYSPQLQRYSPPNREYLQPLNTNVISSPLLYPGSPAHRNPNKALALPTFVPESDNESVTFLKSETLTQPSLPPLAPPHRTPYLRITRRAPVPPSQATTTDDPTSQYPSSLRTPQQHTARTGRKRRVSSSPSPQQVDTHGREVKTSNLNLTIVSSSPRSGDRLEQISSQVSIGSLADKLELNVPWHQRKRLTDSQILPESLMGDTLDFGSRGHTGVDENDVDYEEEEEEELENEEALEGELV
ncbi:hypothetical protein MMC25_006206 [Agyrium rufum]|nr:hypothetical protein [Agyrium rufum]